MGNHYRDRAAAGTKLASRLDKLGPWNRPIVLALPRGGVPVAAPVGRRLECPVSLLAVEKVGVPGRSELAAGAIAVLGDRRAVFRNDQVLALARITDGRFADLVQSHERELRRRADRWLRRTPDLTGRDVILVDDGLATGATMRAAISCLRPARPASITVAVPVGSREAVATLHAVADRVVCPFIPEPFEAVGQAYRDFSQVEERSMLAILAGRR